MSICDEYRSQEYPPRRRLVGWPRFFALVVTFLGTVGRFAQADDLALVRETIAAKGAMWEAGHNEVWDRPPEQRRALLGWDMSFEVREPGFVPETPSFRALPPAFDWRNVAGENYVTPIRDQGQCGSCWAFGALACVESRMAIDAFLPNPTIDLSEQYLVSCSPGSCNGYSISGTCEFLKYNGTITEACMPYQATDAVSCASHCPWGDMEVVRLQNWGWIGPNRDAIKARVLEGPVYVAFVVYADFYAYNGGVYEHVWGEQEGGHAVAIVGWDDALQCWICKNSWGNWGEGGYFRIRYGQCMMEDWSIWLTVQAPSRPNLTVSPITLVEAVGDGDGIANPGEAATLSFWVKNSPYWGTAEGLTLTLSVPGSVGTVRVDQGVASYPTSILPGDSLLCAGVLAVSIDESGPVAEIPLSLTMASNEGTSHPYAKTVTVTVEPSLTQAGWPALPQSYVFAGTACFEANDTTLVAVADRWGVVSLLDPSGELMPGWPVSVGDAVRGAPAVGDLDGDGSVEIVVGSRNNRVTAFRLSGAVAASIPLGGGVVGTTMLADLDDDGLPEVVVASIDSTLSVLKPDGTLLPGWPVNLGAPLLAGPALVPLSGDPLVACGTRAGILHLLDAHGVEASGWPVTLSGEVWTEPVVADFDGDGQWEILCAAKGSVFLVTLDGTVSTLYGGVPLVRSALMALDLNGDAILEAIFSTSDRKLHAVTLDGAHLPGWPRTLQGTLVMGLAAADFDGRGLPEVVCTTDGGVTYFLDGDGTTLPPSPIFLSSAPQGPPSLADLDGDGDLEVVVGTDAGVLAVDEKDRTARPVWPTHRVNLARTGVYVRDTAGSPPAPLPALSLLSVRPVPSTDRVIVRFASTAGQRVLLELHDMAGRKVAGTNLWPREPVTEHLLPLEGLAPGSYRLTLRTATHRSGGLVVRIR